MSKAENVVEYWMLCEKLKEVVRTGWKLWHVEKERLESIAEHVYGTQMLALAMWSEYKYDLDIKKVLMMLACHELEEIKIGDITPFDEGRKTKSERGHRAVEEMLRGLVRGEEIKKIVFEFDAKETAEAKFAYQCDKMEANLQSMMYNDFVNLKKQDGNYAMEDSVVKKCIEETGGVWAKVFIKYGNEKYDLDLDNNFKEIADLIIERA